MPIDDAETEEHSKSLRPIRRFINAYRWELFLLFAVPAAVGLLDFAADEFSIDTVAVDVLLITALTATYPFVRRQGRALLILLWQLVIVLELALLIVSGVQLAIGESLQALSLITVPIAVIEDANRSTSTIVSFHAYDLVRILVYAWFIRRASRISMSHALLLFAVSMADPSFGVGLRVLPSITAYPTPPYIGAAVFHLLTEVGLNALIFRALIRCDVLTPSSRTRTAVGLIIAAALENMLGWFVSWSIIFAPFVLGTPYGSLGYSPIATAAELVEYAIERVAAPLILGYLVRVRARPDGGHAHETPSP